MGRDEHRALQLRLFADGQMVLREFAEIAHALGTRDEPCMPRVRFARQQRMDARPRADRRLRHEAPGSRDRLDFGVRFAQAACDTNTTSANLSSDASAVRNGDLSSAGAISISGNSTVAMPASCSAFASASDCPAGLVSTTVRREPVVCDERAPS